MPFSGLSYLALAWSPCATRTIERATTSDLNDFLVRLVSDSFERDVLESNESLSGEVILTFPGGFLALSATRLILRITNNNNNIGNNNNIDNSLLSPCFLAQVSQLVSLSLADAVQALLFISFDSSADDLYAYFNSFFPQGTWFSNAIALEACLIQVSGFICGPICDASIKPLGSSDASRLCFCSTFAFLPAEAAQPCFATSSPTRPLPAATPFSSDVHLLASSKHQLVCLDTFQPIGRDAFQQPIGRDAFQQPIGRDAFQQPVCLEVASVVALTPAHAARPQNPLVAECAVLELSVGPSPLDSSWDSAWTPVKDVALHHAAGAMSLRHFKRAPGSPPPRRAFPRSPGAKQSLASLVSQFQNRRARPAAPEVQVIHYARAADGVACSAAFQDEAQVLRRFISHSRPDRAVMLVNLEKIHQQWRRWVRNLPRAQPFYAVKCNSDLSVLRTLANLGSNFDCASPAEIDLVLKSLQLAPERVIYSNPCKQEYGIRHAKQRKVGLTTFDNSDELVKLARIHPDSGLLLRIAVDDRSSQCPMSCKFGAARGTWEALLDQARELRLHVCGVHFHVGSGCSQAGVFTAALRDARAVFDLGARRGFCMELINIGGGFPGDVGPATGVTFESLAREINAALDLLFPASGGYSVLAEPGRYFAAASHCLAVKVFARRQRQSADGHALYYVNDGLYGSFNNLLFDHAEVSPCFLIRPSDLSYKGEGDFEPSAIYGQTCDGFDCVKRAIDLPRLEVGDWLLVEAMGAYTVCAASSFNGFELPAKLHVRILDQPDPPAIKSSLAFPEFAPVFTLGAADCIEEGSACRARFRPLSIRPLQSTTQQLATFPRLGGGGAKVNPRLIATLLRSAYCRHRPVASPLLSKAAGFESGAAFSATGFESGAAFSATGFESVALLETEGAASCGQTKLPIVC